MTSCELPRITIDDPGELIDTIPYLLGFHPRQSLVLVGFAAADAPAGAGDPEPRQIQVTIRVDLPPQLPGGLDAHTLQPLSEALRRGQAAAVAAVLVTESVRGPRQSGPLLACRDLLKATMSQAGIDVLDVLAATERRWWSLCCEELDCCSGDGHERVPGCSPAAARATFAGLVALPDRQAMVATLVGRTDEERTALRPWLAEAQRHRAAVPPEHAAGRRQAEIAELLAAASALGAELAAEVRGAGQPGRAAAAGLTDERLAAHAVALTDLRVRDALWLALDDGCEPVSRLMGELHARLPAPYDAAPLFLFGWSQG